MARTVNTTLMLALAGAVGGTLIGQCSSGAAMPVEQSAALTFRQAQGAKPASIFQFSRPSIVVPNAVRPSQDPDPGVAAEQHSDHRAKEAWAVEVSTEGRSGGGRGSVRVIPPAKMDPDEPRATRRPRSKPVLAIEPLPAPDRIEQQPPAADATSQASTEKDGAGETAPGPVAATVRDNTESSVTASAAMLTVQTEDRGPEQGSQTTAEGGVEKALPPVLQPAETATVSGEPGEAMAKGPQTDQTLDGGDVGIDPPASEPNVAGVPEDKTGGAAGSVSDSGASTSFVYGFLSCLLPIGAALTAMQWRRWTSRGKARLLSGRGEEGASAAKVAAATSKGRVTTGVLAAGLVERDRLARDHANRAASDAGRARVGAAEQDSLVQQRPMEACSNAHAMALRTMATGGGEEAREVGLVQTGMPWSTDQHRAIVVGMARRVA